MTECFREIASGKIFEELITYAQYMALPDADKARYGRAYSNTENSMIPEMRSYSITNYEGLEYAGQNCGAGTQGSAALPSSSVVDAAFQAEVRARARAPLAASRRAASGAADDGRGFV